MSRVGQGGVYQSYSVQQAMEILATYNKIQKQLLVRNVKYHGLDQRERYLQLPVLGLEYLSG